MIHRRQVYLTGLAAGHSVALRLRAWQRQEKSWSAFGNVPWQLCSCWISCWIWLNPLWNCETMWNRGKFWDVFLCFSHLRKHMKTQGPGHCSAIRQRRLPPYCFQCVFPLFPPLMKCFKARDMVTFDDFRGSRRNYRCSSGAPSPSPSLTPTVLQTFRIWWDLMTSSTFLGAASGAGVEVSQLLSSIRVAQSQCPRAPGHLGGIPPNQSKVICPNSKHHQHQTSSTSSTS